MGHTAAQPPSRHRVPLFQSCADSRAPVRLLQLRMDRVEQTRLAWQRAQAELQMSLADLERIVAGNGTAEEIQKARAFAASRQKIADELLQRHITQLGKPDFG